MERVQETITTCMYIYIYIYDIGHGVVFHSVLGGRRHKQRHTLKKRTRDFVRQLESQVVCKDTAASTRVRILPRPHV